MPFRSPKTTPKVLKEINQASVEEIVSGALNHDLETQRITFLSYFATDVSFSNHAAKGKGKWSLFKVMRAETFLLPLVYALWHVGLGITLPTILSIPTLLLQFLRADFSINDIRLKYHDVIVDPQGLKAAVFLDQLVKPRLPIPFRKSVVPELKCPTVIHITWKKDSEGHLLVNDFQLTYSTTYLASFFGGPWGVWTHEHLVQPAGRWAFERISDAVDFVAATRAFVAKQLLPGVFNHTNGPNVQATPSAPNAATRQPSPPLSSKVGAMLTK